MVVGPGLGTPAGTLEPMPMCASWDVVVSAERVNFAWDDALHARFDVLGSSLVLSGPVPRSARARAAIAQLAVPAMCAATNSYARSPIGVPMA